MNFVREMIVQMKRGNESAANYCSDTLFMMGKSAVPALIEALKEEDVYGRAVATKVLVNIVEKCKTTEDLEKVEKGIEQGSAVLRKGRVDKGILIDVQITIAKLTREIAKKKDELAPKRDLLLDDKPKPPKKGRGVYHTARMIRNG